MKKFRVTYRTSSLQLRMRTVEADCEAEALKTVILDIEKRRLSVHPQVEMKVTEIPCSSTYRFRVHIRKPTSECDEAFTFRDERMPTVTTALNLALNLLHFKEDVFYVAVHETLEDGTEEKIFQRSADAKPNS